MPKIKPPVRTPHIDMTPMVDLFSVLLIFLLLTASCLLYTSDAADE